MKFPVVSFEMSMGSVSLWAVPGLLENLCGMSCCGTCWPLSGAWFQCRYGGL